MARGVITASPIEVEYGITPFGRTLEVPFASLHAGIATRVPAVEKARARFDRAAAPRVIASG